jgi:hypothetical protein
MLSRRSLLRKSGLASLWAVAAAAVGTIVPELGARHQASAADGSWHVTFDALDATGIGLGNMAVFGNMVTFSGSVMGTISDLSGRRIPFHADAVEIVNANNK